MSQRPHTGRARCIPANREAIFLPYQSAWITDRSRLKIMQKSRQIGLSWSAAWACVERTAAAGAAHDQWVSSRDDLQARLFIEDCKLWASVMDAAARDLGEQIIDTKARTSAYVLEFANGRRIHSMSSNPDAQAGKRGGRVLDEFALHPDPRKLWSVAYPGITWGGNLEVISTHRGSQNFFNELIREVTERGNPKGLSLHTVTLERALDEGFLFKLQQRLSADDPRQAMDEAEYFDFVRTGCADEESFQQEYMCRPADDESAFIAWELIAAAEYANGQGWELALDAPAAGPLFAGIDVGRKHDLTVLWVVEQVGDVLHTRCVQTLQGARHAEQKAVLWPWLARCQRVAIDQTGLGQFLVDDAQDAFGRWRIQGVSFTAQTKEALAWPLRGALEDRKLRIPANPLIRADLRRVRRATTLAGGSRFVAESTPDGHSDRFWALALAVEAASQTATPIEYRSAGPRSSTAARPWGQSPSAAHLEPTPMEQRSALERWSQL